MSCPKNGSDCAGWPSRDDGDPVGSLSTITFHVPGPPQGKLRARVARRGQYGDQIHLTTPKKTVGYEDFIGWSARGAMRNRLRVEWPVHVQLAIVQPIPASWPKKKRELALKGEIWPTSRPDIDNIIKAFLDGLNGVAWVDDVQVVSINATKRYGAMPGVWVTVSPVTPVKIPAE